LKQLKAECRFSWWEVKRERIWRESEEQKREGVRLGRGIRGDGGWKNDISIYRYPTMHFR